MPIDPFEDRRRQSQISQLRGAPAGFDQGNWDNPNMDSVKYDAGRMIGGRTRPSEVGALVSGQDFQTRFPGATFNGKDWIEFQGALSDGDSGSPVHGIDVLKNANAETDTSDGLWWGAPDANPAPQAQMQAPAAKRQGDPIGTLNPAADNSALAKIMAELTAASNDEQSPAEREAIMQMLQAI
jgi:hypothetical protein